MQRRPLGGAGVGTCPPNLNLAHPKENFAPTCNAKTLKIYQKKYGKIPYFHSKIVKISSEVPDFRSEINIWWSK